MNKDIRHEFRDNVQGKLFEELFFEFIGKKYDISRQDLSRLLEQKAESKNSFPVSILKSRLSGLESIVKFLRENRKLSYADIGRLLCRNAKTLAVTYSIASKKMRGSFDEALDSDKVRVPFDAFSKELSVLESICVYLKSQGHKYSEISRLIGKDQRTVWTVCKRAEKKLTDRTRNHGN